MKEDNWDEVQEKDNGDAEAAETEGKTNLPKDAVRSYVSRIENLEEERKTLAEDIKEIYGEADSAGLNKKALKMLIGRRKKARNVSDDQRTLEDLVDEYELAMED